ncbi:hypothetical protein CHS0354_016070 [Potamilus streckersoni]|uniref:Receptor ligand binding region domain-containing protein n=1 Tax=Potamilus streckersoni TaxID=2493646 RepID=A0AAE0W4Y8_9BIVA|nr:hypothetical protein CHS0354_016070 [Potamilus streckersoni]
MSGYSITLVLLVLIIKLLPGSNADGAPETEYCRSTRYSRPGDIMIAVYLAMHETEAGRCGKISASQFALAVGVDYITSLLNGNGSKNESFIPGFKFGYDLFDNCNNEDLTIDMMLDSRQIGGSVKAVECLNDTTFRRLYAGVLVTSSIETAKIILTMLPNNMPVMRPVLSTPDLDSYSNLFRTSSRPDTYAQALVELMKYLKWNYVSLIYTNDSHGRSYKDLIRTKAFKEMICITSEFSLNSLESTDVLYRMTDNIIGQLSKIMATASEDNLGVVYVGSSSSLSLFLDRVCNKSGPSPLLVSNLQWIVIGDLGFDKAVYDFRNAVFNKRCAESVSRRPLFITLTDSLLGQNDYVKHFERLVSNTSYNGPLSSFITEYKSLYCKTGLCTSNATRFKSLANSVFSLATVVKNLCIWTSGSCLNLPVNFPRGLTVNYSNIDPNQVPDSLRTSRPFTYANDGYSEVVGTEDEIEIYAAESSSQVYAQVGLFGNRTLRMNISGIIDHGSSTCKSYCPYCTNTTETKFSYIPGVYLLLGLFTIHSSGENPYSCGMLSQDKNAIITVSAFMEAIKSMNIKYGLQFGGLAIDDCNNPFNISIFLSDFFSKRVLLKDHLTESVINSDTVVAIIGALSSSVSLIVADQATMLGIPMISYAASVSDLDDRDRYPYFMRTVPSDTVQVDTLVKLLQIFGFTHVGTLYYDTDYGRKVIKEFTASAEEVGICVRKPLKVSKDDNDDAIKSTLTRLYEQLTTVVVYFGIPDITIKILKILNGPLGNNEPIVFFASEASVTNDILNNYKSAGFVILATNNRTYIDGGNFARYLSTFNSSTASENMWLPRFWEDVYNCDLKQSFQKTHSSVCASDILSGIDSTKKVALLWEQKTVHVIQAVFSVGSVFANVAKSICKTISYCLELRKQPEIFYNELLSAQLTTDKNDIFKPFNTAGNGNSGFSVYNIQLANDFPLPKIEIGYMDINKTLNIDVKKAKFYNRFGLELKSIDGVKCQQIADCYSKCLTTSTTKLPTPENSTVSPTRVSEQHDKTLTLIAILFGVIIGILIVVLLVLIIVLLRRHAICTPKHEECGQSNNFAMHNTGYIYDEPHTLYSHALVSYPNVSRDILGSAGSIQYSDIRLSLPSIQNQSTSNEHLLSVPSTTSSTNPSLDRLFSPDSTKNVTYLSSRDLDIQGSNDEEEEECEDNDRVENHNCAYNSLGNNILFSNHGKDNQSSSSGSSQHDTGTSTYSENCNTFSPTSQENQTVPFDRTERVSYTLGGQLIYKRTNFPELKQGDYKQSLTLVPDIIPHGQHEINETGDSILI